MEKIAVLASSSVAATSMPWLSIFTKSGQISRSPSDRVRLGIIGPGKRGRTLIKNIQAIQEYENVEISAVCDDYEPHLQEALRLTNGEAKSFSNYRKLLDMKDIDGVIIATPPHEHAHMAIDALNSGAHVYCEKSMARTIEDTKHMYDAHIQANKILVIGHQRLFSTVYLEAIQMIHKGAIGPITQLRGCWHKNTCWRRILDSNGVVVNDPMRSWEWTGDKNRNHIRSLQRANPALDRRINWRLYDEYAGGLITELGSHHFQVANWIMESPPVSVVGKGSIALWNDGREVYDNFACVFKYPDGVHLAYDCSVLSGRYNGAQVQVIGTTETMELESNKRYLEDPPTPPAIRRLIHNIERNLFEVIPIGGATWVPDTPVDVGGKYISDKYEMNETKLFLEAFIKYIREGSAPKKLLQEGYYASIWSLLVEKAIKTNNEVTLPKGYKI